MKKAVLAILLLVSAATFAQDKKAKMDREPRLTKEEKVDLQVKRMTKDLSLNEKQAKEVRAVVTKEVEKREAKRAELTAQKTKERAEMKAEREKQQDAFAGEMKKVLTPEQFTKWEKGREEKKAKLKEKMAERRGKASLTPVEEDK